MYLLTGQLFNQIVCKGNTINKIRTYFYFFFVNKVLKIKKCIKLIYSLYRSIETK